MSEMNDCRYRTSNGMEINMSQEENKIYIIVNDIVKRHTDSIRKELKSIDGTLRGNGKNEGLVAKVASNTTRINKLEKIIIGIATSVGVYIIARFVYEILSPYI